MRLRLWAWLIVISTLAVILGGTLFPFKFSWRNRRSLTHSFGLAKDIAARGNDLLIGVDGGLGQSFKGRIDDLHIYRRALTAAEISQEPTNDPDMVLSFAFDENSGDVVHDASGKENLGRLVKPPQWVPDEHGSALRFTGTREVVRVPNSPSIDITGRGITISMRVALEGPVQRFDETILAKPWHSNSPDYPWYQYAIEFDSNGSQTVDFYFADISGRPRGPFLIKPPVGPWTHVAFTYDGSRVRGYVDGREQPVSPLNPWHPGDIFRNILLFLPLGFGLAALLRAKNYSAAAVIALTVLLAAPFSLGIEILQSLLPQRWSSLVDIATNTIGAATGSVFYLFLRRLGEIGLAADEHGGTQAGKPNP